MDNTKLTYQQAAQILSKMHLDHSNIEEATIKSKLVIWYGIEMSIATYKMMISQLKSLGKILVNPSQAKRSVCIHSSRKLKNDILHTFKVGCRFTRAEVKIELGMLYKQHGIAKAAVYTDLMNFLTYEEFHTTKSRCIKITSHTTTK